jgi:hypothetical protein
MEEPMSPETRAKLLVGDDDEAQINELAERLKLAWQQGASVAELEALAGELAAGRGW